MIYFPSKNKSDITRYAATGVEAVPLITNQGLELTAWYKAPRMEKETLVFFHGNASSHEGNILTARPYLEQGYGFLSIGYPGYEGNDGKPYEDSLYEAARTSINYLNKDLQTPQNQIVLYGQSIGTGVAVQMATEYDDIKSVILEAPYTSLPAVAAKQYFFVPVKLLMKDKYDSLSKIKNVKAPLLVLYGSEDRIIPPAFSQRLFDTANEPKKIIELFVYGHNDMPVERRALETIKFLKAL